MILNYTVPNAEKNILAGIKIHSMREDKTDRWKAGKLIHHCIGARSKNYKCFLQNPVVSTQLVLIVFDKIKTKTRLVVTIDRKRVSQNTIIKLVLNDGFDSIQDFINWFFHKDNKTGYRKRTMWAGKLIHWTDLKYTNEEKKCKREPNTRQSSIAC